MTTRLTLTGDINLMGVQDPDVPFRHLAPRLHDADVVFSNLECCFFDGGERSVTSEGFYADPAMARALSLAGVQVIGNANNVNYGASAIRASLDCLDSHGIAHVGAGRNRAEARQPVVLERDGIRFGFYQRTSVYWTHGHEADEITPGVAVLPGHTAYRPRLEELKSLTRPGNPPEVLTWADRGALQTLRDEIAALRPRCDVLVASHHWGLGGEVLTYQREIAHAAIDAGADLVFGHGPHEPLPLECYAGKTIVYGAGSFSFETGHRARKHPDWLGLMVEAEVENGKLVTVHLQFVRHNAANETIVRSGQQESTELANLSERSAALGARLVVDGDRVAVQAITT